MQHSTLLPEGWDCRGVAQHSGVLALQGCIMPLYQTESKEEPEHSGQKEDQMTRTSQMFQCAQQLTSPLPSSILGPDVSHSAGDICFPMHFEQKSRLSYHLRIPPPSPHTHTISGKFDNSSRTVKTRKTTCLASLPEVCGHGWPSRGGQPLVGNLVLLLKSPRTCGLW